MGRLSAKFVEACNLRTAVIVFALWLLLGAHPPIWFSDAATRLDRTVFRAGLYVSELPVPRISITVVHVPDIEYDRWLADLAGASGLHNLLLAVETSDASTRPMVGLVLEQPFVLIQPQSESILAQLQRGRMGTDPLYQQTADLLQRRQYLVEQLQSEQVILGLLDQVPGQFRPLATDLGQLAQFPPWLRPWLQQSPPGVSANTGSPALHYLPIPLNPRAKQYLVLQTQQKYLPTFWAQFLAATAQYAEGSTVPRRNPQMFWHRDGVLAFGKNEVPLGSDAGFVPLYGAVSGIHSSLRQVSLEAALAAQTFGDWILIGRDGDGRLQQVAQVLASVGNHAVLAEPWWWPGLHKALLIAAALVLGILVPLLRWRSNLALLLFVTGGAALLQVLGQSLAFLWLPSGTLISFCLLAYVALWLWRWQMKLNAGVIARADAASLDLARSLTAKGEFDRAFELCTSCRSSDAVLDQMDLISRDFEAQGQFTQAWHALREIRRRKHRYKDVPRRLKRMKYLAVSQSAHAPAPLAQEHAAGAGVDTKADLPQ